jgi:isopenicillin N synthase-like dioxygenase
VYAFCFHSHQLKLVHVHYTDIGDMLSRWTNNIYVSTPHRVLPTTTGSSSSTCTEEGKPNNRISIPFFFDPNYDSIIAPIDKLVKESGRPPCFEPIMYGDHLLAKTSKNFVL